MSKKSPPKDLLDWLAITNTPNWRVARPIGGLVSVLVAILIFGAFAAAFVVLGRVIFFDGAQTAVGKLGAGALIVAILGAPFLVWSTVIKQKTVEFQKESHITDRISKAVEQLGEEKTVDRIGRSITIKKQDVVGDFYEKTNIQWRGEPVPIDDEWKLKETGPWQAFSETVPNIEVRIGGLLSLERIAQDSTTYDKGRDHVRVMEILCAYVRENSNARPPEDFPEPDWEPLGEGATDEERKAHVAARKERFGDLFNTSKAWNWAQALPNPRADIQQALDILGRRSAEQRAIEARWGKDAAPEATWVFDTACPSLPDEPSEEALSAEALATYRAKLEEWKGHIAAYRGYRLDLRGTNLQGADLSDATLSGARLSDARLEGADLIEARMEGAVLRDARIEGAILIAVRMQGAILDAARMEGATLSEARMEQAVLRDARMERADLMDAQLEGADLSDARLQGAGFIAARMEGADFSRARMEGANLLQARMDSATNLAEALLRGASVRFVKDADTMAQLAPFLGEMFGDGSVKLPEGVSRPAHWPDWELPPVGLTSGGPNGFERQWQLWLSDPENYTPPPKPAD